MCPSIEIKSVCITAFRSTVQLDMMTMDYVSINSYPGTIAVEVSTSVNALQNNQVVFVCVYVHVQSSSSLNALVTLWHHFYCIMEKGAPKSNSDPPVQYERKIVDRKRPVECLKIAGSICFCLLGDTEVDGFCHA